MGKETVKGFSPKNEDFRWTFGISFPSLEYAIDCARAMARDSVEARSDHVEFCVFQEEEVVWREYTEGGGRYGKYEDVPEEYRTFSIPIAGTPAPATPAVATAAGPVIIFVPIRSRRLN